MSWKPDIGFSKRLFKLLKDPDACFFVECGANDGVSGSVTWWFEKERGWKGILLDANPHCYQKMVENRPDCINLHMALSDSRGSSSFTFPLDCPRGLYPGGGRLGGTFGSSPTETHEVSIDTYENMIVDHNIARIDLFVLDVEGHELEVLRGAQGAAVQPRVWAIETNKITVDEIFNILGPLGYEVAGGDRSNTYFLKVDCGA